MKPYLPGQQKLNYTCGPTCIANALALYGLPTSQEACQGASSCGTDGTNLRMLAQGIRKFGFYPIMKGIKASDPRWREKEPNFLKWVKKETDKGRFVIIGINGNGREGHWILALKIQGRRIMVWDPSEKLPTVVTRRNLFKAWRNTTPAVDATTAKEFKLNFEDEHLIIHGISMSPRSALARRAVDIRVNLITPKAGLLPTAK